MEPVHLAHEDGRESTANEHVEALVTWKMELEQFVGGSEDPRELALVAVELEDLLAYALEYLGDIKRRVRELNAGAGL